MTVAFKKKKGKTDIIYELRGDEYEVNNQVGYLLRKFPKEKYGTTMMNFKMLQGTNCSVQIWRAKAPREIEIQRYGKPLSEGGAVAA